MLIFFLTNNFLLIKYDFSMTYITYNSYIYMLVRQTSICTEKLRQIHYAIIYINSLRQLTHCVWEVGGTETAQI